MKNIVFLDSNSLGKADLTEIAALGRYTGYGFTAPDKVVERCKDADIVLTNKVVMSRDIMFRLPRLRMIAVVATGMNNVDLNAAADLGITVRNVAGYSTTSVAECTLAFVLALTRNLIHYDSYIKSGAYSVQEEVFHLDAGISNIRGKKWGIIGLGAIGHEVARLACAFGAEVAYFSTSGIERSEPYRRLGLEELLSESDIVSIHSPLNDQTRGIIGREQLGRMKQNAILVNVARGGIVDERALAEAIDGGIISGAALDVFSSEPLRESPLYSIRERSRIIMSPHTAWAADDAVRTLIHLTAQNIRQFIADSK